MHNCPTCGAFPVPESRPVDGRSALECDTRSAVHDGPVRSRSAESAVPKDERGHPPITGMLADIHKLLNVTSNEVDELVKCLEPALLPEAPQASDGPCLVSGGDTELERVAFDIANRITLLNIRIRHLACRVRL